MQRRAEPDRRSERGCAASLTYAFGKMKAIRYITAALLILPSAWLVWFTAQHLWRLYGSSRGYSFGLHVKYGSEIIHDPWSDAILLPCAIAALVSGIMVACGAKKKILIWLVGAVMLAIIVIGVIRAP